MLGGRLLGLAPERDPVSVDCVVAAGDGKRVVDLGDQHVGPPDDRGDVISARAEAAASIAIRRRGTDQGDGHPLGTQEVRRRGRAQRDEADGSARDVLLHRTGRVPRGEGERICRVAGAGQERVVAEQQPAVEMHGRCVRLRERRGQRQRSAAARAEDHSRTRGKRCGCSTRGAQSDAGGHVACPPSAQREELRDDAADLGRPLVGEQVTSACEHPQAGGRKPPVQEHPAVQRLDPVFLSPQQ